MDSRLGLYYRKAKARPALFRAPFEERMSITFYYGSGSPPAWRVWLGLEHKQLPYEIKTLSFSAEDNRKPEYLAISPRGKVPAIVDDGFALYESVAILEYLEQRYPDSGSPLYPRDAKQAAITRRIIQEVDAYLSAPVGRLVRQTLMSRDGGDAKEIASAREEVLGELSRFEGYFEGDFLLGALSAADYALYPSLALLGRIDAKRPEHAITAAFGPKLAAWKKRIEALPYFEKTTPPHWKQ